MLAVASPLQHAAGKYVAAAYIVFVVMLLIYLAIMTVRTSRTSRELDALRRDLAERRAGEELNGPALRARVRPARGEAGEEAQRESGSLREPAL